MPAFGGVPIMGGSMNGPQPLFGTKTVVLSVKDGLTLLPLHSIEGDTFEGRNLADRDINPWTHTQRDAGGNYARYIFPPSCNRYPHASLALATFVSGRG